MGRPHSKPKLVKLEAATNYIFHLRIDEHHTGDDCGGLMIPCPHTLFRLLGKNLNLFERREQ